MRVVLQEGKRMLSEGATALDTVEAVIRGLEDDVTFNAGRGAVLTSAGRAELDASIMDGRNRACGAVGGVTIIRHPITLARRVMTETKHVLLAGPGANRFGKRQGVEIVEPDYFRLQPDEKKVSVSGAHPEAYFGTVGCVVLDAAGNLAAGTSTGGLSGKMPGRLGDTPIVGAGTFADNATCAISATGTGEEFIRNAICYDVSAQMRYLDRNVQEAVRVAMTERLKPNMGGLIAVGHDGMITLQHNTAGMTCGAADSRGKFEVQLQTE
jgi:beta-aspartyl-peptidase (threonine type)